MMWWQRQSQPSTEGWVLCGAYGYTGELIARRAKEHGLAPILAGRNAEKLRPLAEELDLPYAQCSLNDRRGLDLLLEDASAVLHCAGPFLHTARPMLEACLRTGTHYLDITGEVEVFELIAAHDAHAHDAGVMLLPGVGFDVVPSDYLASYLKTRFPSMQKLVLALRGLDGVSRGTATTMVEYLGRNGVVRSEGALTEVPSGWRTRSFDFGAGPEAAVSIPWGDVFTAYYSTGVEDIEVYAVVPAPVRRALVWLRYTGALFRNSLIKRFLRWKVRHLHSDPDSTTREHATSTIYGEGIGNGHHVAAILRGPGAYTVTVEASLAALRRVLAGEWKLGYQTPTTAYGCGIMEALPEIEIEDLDE